MVSAPESASAVCQPSCQHQPAQGRDGHGQHDLKQTETEHVLAHRPQLGQAEFQPDHEHQENHPELAQVPDAVGVLGQGQRMGSDEHARPQVAQHRRQAQEAAGDHADDCREQVHQREVEGRHAPMLLNGTPFAGAIMPGR
jgi:hypothetical protein